MEIVERLSKLRDKMRQEDISVCLIPTADDHRSEYVSDFFKVREYFSGFTGSAGSLVVKRDRAYLFTDSRYFSQAKEQLVGSGIELMKEGLPDSIKITDCIMEGLSEGDKVALDGRVISLNFGLELRRLLDDRRCILVTDFEPAKEIWEDRPRRIYNPVWILEEKYTGENAKSKISRIYEKLKSYNADSFIVCALDEIAWILNLRGQDIECNPVFFSYLVFTSEDATLYGKINDSGIIEYLGKIGVKLRDYEEFYTKGIERVNICTKQGVLLDKDDTNLRIADLLSEDISKIYKESPVISLKAVKNSTEIEAIHTANVKDGVAMVRFNRWLKESVLKGENLTELSVSDKLLEFRMMDNDIKGLSFDTICAYGSHGAIVHYEATLDSNADIVPGNLLLIDSGAQYFGGTTDVTRTYSIGNVDKKLKQDYTMVLKAMLKIMNLQFKAGTTSHNIDMVGRMFFWDRGMDYGHSTGHGIGAGLNVHEKGVFINWASRINSPTRFVPGMLCSDEPGLYIEGSHGIRIETDILCEERFSNEFGRFLGFKPMTLVPIDIEPILMEEMDEESIYYLNKYHEKVYEELSPYLSGEDLDYLKELTKPVEK